MNELPLTPRPQADRAWQHELLRYGMVGGAAFLLDFSVLRLCLGAGLHYLLAAAAGFACGLGLNFMLSVAWVWRGTRARTPGAFATFTLIGLGGLALTELLMRIAVGSLGLPPALAKLPIAGLVLLWNFGLRRRLVFYR